jgi:CelD/BcsL family acetyltransferase involved in cellulose biosynthesis
LVSPSPRVILCNSPEDLLQFRPLWESMCSGDSYTLFQKFDLNLLAARTFAAREQPVVICAEASYGAAIIPAVISTSQNCLRLLGEELFDYRSFLHEGDPGVLQSALATLAEQGLPLKITAVREEDCAAFSGILPLSPFCCAPAVLPRDITAEQFALAHTQLDRNLRRLARLGFELHRYRGDYPGLVRFIYRHKAAQTADSLFRDPARIEFMVNAAALLADRFEVFTLEDDASIAAALVILREERCRRFYTGWFAPQLQRHSPALSLIYEVTRQSLAEGLDCDYMTGEQPYKLRLATSRVPLYRVQATAEQLADVTLEGMGELTQAA